MVCLSSLLSVITPELSNSLWLSFLVLSPETWCCSYPTLLHTSIFEPASRTKWYVWTGRGKRYWGLTPPTCNHSSTKLEEGSPLSEFWLFSSCSCHLPLQGFVGPGAWQNREKSRGISVLSLSIRNSVSWSLSQK